MLHPLLENDICKCAHSGIVQMKSGSKSLLTINNVGVITINDLAQASIVGCTNNISGVPAPCTKLVNMPVSITSSLIDVGGQKVVLAEKISQITTDKGSPLMLQGIPKASGVFEVDK